MRFEKGPGIDRGLFIKAAVKQNSENDSSEWEKAEAALKAAQKLPGGPERIEALKKAGQMRFDADKRRKGTEKAHESG